MTEIEQQRLEAKIKAANSYLKVVVETYGKYDLCDAYKVVTREMRQHVKVVRQDEAEADGLGFVRLRKQGVV